MSIKMNRARLISSGEKLTIDNILPSDNGNLKCYYCDAKVSYVNAYRRETKNGTTYVNPFIRLFKKEQHAISCKYNVENLIETLVAESKNIEDTDDSIFEIKDEKKYSFRLHFLEEATKRALEGEDDLYINDFEKTSFGRKYKKINKTLATYIKTAAGVAKLYEIVKDDDAKKLKDSIELIFNGSTISWDDFFYTFDRYDILFDKASKKEIIHPVAVHIIVKSEAEEKINKKYRFSFQCFSGNNEAGSNHIEIPRILTVSEEIAQSIKAEGAYIIVTTPFAYPENNNKFRNIFLPIGDTSQIKYLGTVSKKNREISESYLQAKIRNWQSRIDELYQKIRHELSPLGDIECTLEGSTIMNEELMQKYKISPIETPILKIKKNNKLIATFKPIGLLTIGGNGRIDILTKEGSYILSDLADSYDSSRWEVFHPSNRTNSRKFDSGFIAELVR